MSFLKTSPHRRYNPLTDEWILVSPQRTLRPWLGKHEPSAFNNRPSYDPNCYLCPGNKRASGEVNANYDNTYVFTNDFEAIQNVNPPQKLESTGFLKAQTVKGTCKVVCFSPRHDLTLAHMSSDQIQNVIKTWIDETEKLKHAYNWVQIFENKGEIMGCSNPHPHGQIWASDFIPQLVTEEIQHMKNYTKKTGKNMLQEYLNEELKSSDRIVIENEDWVALVPFWAIWPYELILLPKSQFSDLTKIDFQHQISLSQILKKLLSAYDQLFSVSMPYSMGWHFVPFSEKDNLFGQLHAHFYPPLLRSGTIKKFMVGYEMLAEAQRDITPEQAAETLRKLL